MPLDQIDARGRPTDSASTMATEQWHLRPPNPANPVVFVDVSIGGAAVGRVKMELWKDCLLYTSDAADE